MKRIIKKISKLFTREKVVIRYVDRTEEDFYHQDGHKKTMLEIAKTPTRTDILNFLVGTTGANSKYLEIGVRNPNDNFNKINVNEKYSVDPGIEFEENPVDFKFTSDEFFQKLNNGEILNKDIRFDVIFIDGLHLAEQVDRDIKNALDFISDSGFIVLHDCNPPTEFHASETYSYMLSPSKGFWNGTTWKAFFKYRKQKEIYSCCVDTDWGIGVISKKTNLGEPSQVDNDYYEFKVFEDNRKDSLNLLSFEDFKKKVLADN
ncbi:class I SAM-dependent methyltransferase [Flavobacterium amniphilum]|uniref:class I SAM-dependent methyltransferase n=1 Tax=Flavobacterium amniphilum TaxID=1834035 RepID=UPI002029F169|nr:class I SAM-dependent methyltransferase [Flavobacterium amniphilum]MCL9805117.1 class I SAM-dependent methyltransferase [Flavobacterium amniphilum]